VVAERVGNEESVNDIQADGDGFLVGTDRGLFAYRPGNITKEWSKLGNYSRSVRQLYRYSDYEWFVATQDGLFYLEGNNLRQIGKNAEIDTFVGKRRDDVVVTADTEIGFGNGEEVTFVDCKSHITAAVPVNEQWFVGTLSALFSVADSGFTTVVSRFVVKDMAPVGNRLLIATPSDLRWVEPDKANSPPQVIRAGDFSKLQEFPGGILAIGSDRLYILNANGVPMFDVVARNARTTVRMRQFGQEIFFCLNNGVLHGLVGIGDSGGWYFEPISSPVSDIGTIGDGFILATDLGIMRLPTRNGWERWGLALVLGVVVIACGVGVWWWWWRRRPIIFISYRRGDSRDVVGRLRHQLAAKFGSNRVRVDVQDIQPGVDYRDEILRHLRESQVILAVIGPSWLKAQDSGGRLRLFAEQDYVRYEIETALVLHKSVIPVLLDDTEIPPGDKLPTTILQLSYLQSNRLRHDPDFDNDVVELIHAIQHRARDSTSLPFRDPRQTS
jgi:hypothetical protein